MTYRSRATLAPFASSSTLAGGVIVGHLLPPVPSDLVWKTWRGEYIDLNLLLPHRLGAPESTLADVLRHKTKELKEIKCIED